MYTKSYLKYAGSKSKILSTVLEHIHNDVEMTDFVEPFFGSGVVGINVKADNYWFNDGGPDIASVHNAIKDDVGLVLENCLELWKGGYEEYYTIREHFRRYNDSPHMIAAMFVYMNRFGYNGMVRYSSKGFNVPVGDSTKGIPNIPEDALYFMSERLEECIGYRGKVDNLDFEEYVHKILFKMKMNGRRATFYSDPPYVPMSATMSDINYTGTKFDREDHIRLASIAERCKDKGHRFLISNHDNEVTRDLYSNANIIIPVEVYRSISSKKTTRGNAKELIAIYE